MWLKMWCISTVVWFVLFPLQIWLLACKPFSDASDPPPEPRIKSSYSFGKTFLGLDKCNACIGTSMCKKFFKDEIRFENWLCPRLKLPSDYLQSYSGNYTDDSESWRQVEISRLMSKHQHDLSDKRICASISKIKSCSIEQVLMKTERFRKWSLAKRLTPDLVQDIFVNFETDSSPVEGQLQFDGPDSSKTSDMTELCCLEPAVFATVI